MTSPLRRLALVCLAALFVASAPLTGRAGAETTDVRLVTDLVNRERAAAGLPALVTDVRLVAIAASWSSNMAATGVLAHNPLFDDLAPAGWTRLAENVGYGSTVNSVHTALMNSPGHRGNILHPDVNAMGVGVAYGNGRVWVTQNFMKHSVLQPASPVVNVVGTGPGYRLIGADGGVYTFASAPSLAPVTSVARVAAGAATPTGLGYWLVDEAGRVQPRGDAGSFGGLEGRTLNAPIVGMAATPSGRGYWLLGRDGGIFSFGDATFHGSTGGIPLNQPVVGMTSTATGRGYWFVAADGGIFSFGDAAFHGSTGGIPLNQPVVGMAAHPSGQGYWLVARDGGIFSFGAAPFHGSTGSVRLNQPITAMTVSSTGRGYRFVATDGGVFSFGDAPFRGSLGSSALNAPIVGMVFSA